MKELIYTEILQEDYYDILFLIDNKSVWLPRSQMKVDKVKKKIEISNWLYEKEF